MLLGWMLDFRFLQQPLPGGASMKANTALALMLAGFSLRCRATDRHAQWSLVIAATVALAALVTLSQDVFGWDLGIDEVLVTDHLTTDPFRRGRMAAVTAVCLFCLGTALVSCRRHPILSQTLALAAGLLSLVAVLGHIYEVRALYAVGPYSTMAIHTALLLLVLTAGVLWLYPESGLVSVVLADGPGGLTARRLLPIAVLSPIAIGWLRLMGRQAGYYDPGFSLAIGVVATVVVMSVVILVNARSIGALDVARQRATLDLQHLALSLERRVAEQTAEINDSLKRKKRCCARCIIASRTTCRSFPACCG